MHQLDFLHPLPARRPKWDAYGAGLDSLAGLLERLEAGERPDGVAFCDVSNGSPTRDPTDPGEWPETYDHLRSIVMPLCQREGIAFEWIDTERYPVRGERSLIAWMKKVGQIPTVGPGRLCTIVGKTERFERFLGDRYPGQAVEVWVGFDASERKRAAWDPNAGTRRRRLHRGVVRTNRFPLIEAGLCRCRCAALVKRLGFAVPPKSACMMCGYSTKGDFQRCAKQQPAAFAEIVDLEARKSPTSEGYKLSIKDFRKHKDAAGNVVSYQAPPLPVFIEGPYTPRRMTCAVCGGVRVSKAAGVPWRDGAA